MNLDFKFHELIEIDWLDTVTDPSWQSPEELEHYPPTKCHTTGYFINRDAEVIRVCGSYQEDGSDVTVIPIGCIRRVKRR